MPAPEAGRIKVIFVTTDPDRDTPKRIRDWLDSFDPTFIGLRGTPEELATAQQAINMPVAQEEAPDIRLDSSREGSMERKAVANRRKRNGVVYCIMCQTTPP